MEKLADGCLGWRTKLSEEYDNVSLLFSNSSREEEERRVSFSPLRVSSSSLLKHSISYITHSLLLSEAKRVDRETGGIGTCHFEKRRSINERGISIRGGA